VPQAELLELLASVRAADKQRRGGGAAASAAQAAGDDGDDETPVNMMDCSVVKTRHAGLTLISTTDFFYPLVDSAYEQGRVACANVLSDLYAMGVWHCDTMLMTLAASTDMDAGARHRATELMMRGFNDLARDAGTTVTGGQSVLNPWPIIGGVASAVCKSDEFIAPEHAVAGDVLVLTKPLGTQVAVNVHEWLHKAGSPHWARVVERCAVPTSTDGGGAAAAATRTFGAADALAMYDAALASMVRLNRSGARLMHTHGAHAATDVTGFGILGHARNLAQAQRAPVRIVIDTLPVIANTELVDSHFSFFGLLRGTSAETSGGLLVALPADTADAFIADVAAADGAPAWRVGRVLAATGDDDAHDAVLADDVRVVRV